MSDIASKNEQELREIVISQSEAIVKLINQLEAQETIFVIAGITWSFAKMWKSDK